MNDGCDQPRGESRPELIVQLLEQRRISEDRTDSSTSAASSGSGAELYVRWPVPRRPGESPARSHRRPPPRAPGTDRPCHQRAGQPPARSSRRLRARHATLDCRPPQGEPANPQHPADRQRAAGLWRHATALLRHQAERAPFDSPWARASTRARRVSSAGIAR